MSSIETNTPSADRSSLPAKKRRIKKTIVIVAIILLAIYGLGTCYLKYNYTYQSVLDTPSEKECAIALTDSVSIIPTLSIEDGFRFVAAINVEPLTDSVVFKTLDINITSLDDPTQPIKMTHVITYVDPLIPERIDYVSAHTFDQLPEHYKTVSVKRNNWNTFIFRFETPDIDKSKHYHFKITGAAIYKKKLIPFEKEINVLRKKDYVPYQMMTRIPFFR